MDLFDLMKNELLNEADNQEIKVKKIMLVNKRKLQQWYIDSVMSDSPKEFAQAMEMLKKQIPIDKESERKRLYQTVDGWLDGDEKFYKQEIKELEKAKKEKDAQA